MNALAQQDKVILPKVRGVQWVQQPSGFFISLLFPWGCVDARLLQFAPHYAINRTLPLRDAQFWMWSVLGTGHYQLKNIQQTAYCVDWQKDFGIAMEHCIKGIDSVVNDLERFS
jgi:hypothetical protein